MKMKKRNKISTGSKMFDVFNYVFLALFTLLVIYPFWDMIMLSFANPKTSTTLELHLINKDWSLASYRYLFEDGRVFTAYWNTIFRTVVTTMLAMVMTLLAAYPLSKRDLPYRTLITMFFLITMYFSGGLIPKYMLIRDIGLINSRWVLILPGIFGVYNMIIMRNYLMSLDNALEEAAFIEGANYLQILTKIVVPLSKPVLATIALWVAVANWNAWFDCMIYIQDKNLIVLQQLLRDMTADNVTSEMNALAYFNSMSEVKITVPSIKAAIIILTIGPIVLVYPFIQKHFVKGIMIGSLKG